MPATSMRRPGKNRASRSVTRRSGSSGPAAAATWVAIWRLLHLTDLISRINPTDIRFSGKTPRRAAGRPSLLSVRGSFERTASRWVHRKAEEKPIVVLSATTTTPRGAHLDAVQPEGTPLTDH